jgi:predicted ATPase
VRELPSGTVTFLFTDIEGSTRLLHQLGDGYADALAEHRRLLREAFSRQGGVEVDTQGDAFFVVFSAAGEAVAAAKEAQEALASGPIRVRMGLHTGQAQLSEEGYVGLEVHKGARIAASGHGGQVLLSQATRDLVKGDLRDLGEHRVKDFSEPVWIFQLGDERFPPLKTISNTNLPRPASSFVGRERELGQLVALLQNGARLVTLSGPGGSGKTRLAIEAAAELVPEHRNGVFWVGLTPVRDSALVLETISETLGAQEQLTAHIGERELLLLLDNFEQVVEAAPDLSALLEACPNLCLLVTSRELLRIQGEVEYAVPPLTESEAVELFCARAQLGADEQIVELCRRLDNLPLAVELAAARTNVLSPVQILERLSQSLDLLKGGRDAEARQETLRATIEWSYDLLTEEEQRLFASMAVFAGGCTLEAAEQVAEADLDTLQSLVDKSLLRHTGERFWMLETIQEYALERLESMTEAAQWRHRHAEHFIALAQQAEEGGRRAEQGLWWDRLEADHDNIRAVLDWSEASDRAALGLELELGGLLWRFWGERGYAEEGLRRLERALELGAGEGAVLRARALRGAANLARLRGELERARMLGEAAVELYESVDDRAGTARALNDLGIGMVVAGDLEQARPLFERARTLAIGAGDTRYVAISIGNLGELALDQGDYPRCIELCQESARLSREFGDASHEAANLHTLALAAFRLGEVERARAMLRESLECSATVGSLFGLPEALVLAAAIEASCSHFGRASTLIGAAEGLEQEMGVELTPAGKGLLGDTAALLRSRPDPSELADLADRGREMTSEAAVQYALSDFARG